MYLKRDRDTDALPESEQGLASSEPHLESPTKKAFSEVLQSLETLQTSDDIFCPSYLYEFIEREKLIFSRLVNFDVTESLIEYLKYNPELTAYIDAVRDALMKLSYAETARMKANDQFEPKQALIRNITHKKTNKPRKKINFALLLDLLSPAKTTEAKALLQILEDGMKSWHLPLYLNLLAFSIDETRKKTLDALTWIEKRRGFIQSLMNRDPKLLQWLNEEATDDIKAILSGFTKAMHTLLNEEVDLTFGDGSVLKTPKLLDIRAVYHTLTYLKEWEKAEEDKMDGVDTDNDSQVLHFCNLEKLCTKGPFLKLFLEVSASPWNCFLEIFNSPAELPAKSDVLRVTRDVLSWLFLAHPQNSVLCTKIMRRAVGVDMVFQAYERHKKQANAKLLGVSMHSMLQSAQSSPSKAAEKRGREVENSPSSSPKSRVSAIKNPKVDSPDSTPTRLSPTKLFG